MAAYLSVYRPFPKSEQTGKREKKEDAFAFARGAQKSLLERRAKKKRKPIKKVSKKQAKRIKKLAEIPPPEDGLCEE